MTYSTEKQNMQIATLHLTATAYWTSLCCCLLFEKYHIASISIAEILQKKKKKEEHHVCVLEGHHIPWHLYV